MHPGMWPIWHSTVIYKFHLSRKKSEDSQYGTTNEYRNICTKCKIVKKRLKRQWPFELPQSAEEESWNHHHPTMASARVLLMDNFSTHAHFVYVIIESWFSLRDIRVNWGRYLIKVASFYIGTFVLKKDVNRHLPAGSRLVNDLQFWIHECEWEDNPLTLLAKIFSSTLMVFLEVGGKLDIVSLTQQQPECIFHQLDQQDLFVFTAKGQQVPSTDASVLFLQAVYKPQHTVDLI